MTYLDEGESIWLEVWVPENIPQSVIDNLKANNFDQSSDGFYIPEDALELFQLLAFPYKVTVFQRFIYKPESPEECERIINDMVGALTDAGVQGVGKWLDKTRSSLQLEEE